MRTLHRYAPVATIAALSLTVAACGGDDAVDTGTDTGVVDETTDETTEPMDEMTTSEPMETETTAAALPAEGPFGEACGQVPTEGEGSVEGMTDDPVATAASNNPLLSQLTSAVQQAELVDTLNNAEDLTVFAPINSAFEAIPSEQMDQVMSDTDLLSSILLYHVHQGDQYSAQELVDQGSITTLNEQAGPIEVTAEGETLMVEAAANTASVVCAQVQTANATVYLVDSVLLPQEMGAGDTGTETETSTESG